MSIRLTLSASILALTIPFAMPALAAGGDSTDQPCPSGQVRDKDSKECVPAKQGAVDDDSLFEQGRALAYAGRHGEAIVMLGLVADKNDPRVLNMLGFAHRKSGRIEIGLGYYEAALAANPDFTLAREYMGEAYLSLGDLDAARGQLAEIERRCGTGCTEYGALASQIAAAAKG